MTNEEFQRLVLEQFAKIDQRFDSLAADVKDIKAGQVRMENKFDEQIGALKDGFELRGDQVGRLQEHLDERLDSIENDLSFVVGKVAQHDRNFIQIRKSNRVEKL